MQQILDNPQKAILILFAVVTAIAFLAVVIGSMFGRAPSADVFELLKLIIAACLGGVLSNSASLYIQARQK